MDKVKVPDGMLRAAKDALRRPTKNDKGAVHLALEGALEWLQEHPMVPTDEQLHMIAVEAGCADFLEQPSGLLGLHQIIDLFQRRMFRADEPDAEIADLLDAVPACIGSKAYAADGHTVDHLIRQAFARGLAKAQGGER